LDDEEAENPKEKARIIKRTKRELIFQVGFESGHEMQINALQDGVG